MTCRQFAEFMADYLAGELPPEIVGQFEQHLEICLNCRKYLTSYEESVKLGKQAFQDPDAGLPDDVPEDLVRAILTARHRA